jgi:hypothetical protein
MVPINPSGWHDGGGWHQKWSLERTVALVEIFGVRGIFRDCVLDSGTVRVPCCVCFHIWSHVSLSVVLYIVIIN